MSKFIFTSSFMVIVLVLLSAACSASPTKPAVSATAPAAPVAAPADTVPFKSVTYTNDEYNFSIKYPQGWDEKTPDWKYQVYVAKPATFYPSITITVYPGPGIETQKDLLPKYYDSRKVTDLKWISNKEYVTARGIKGELVNWTYTWPPSIKLESYAFAVDRDGKRIAFGITQLDGMMDYDACKTIFDTIVFK